MLNFFFSVRLDGLEVGDRFFSIVRKVLRSSMWEYNSPNCDPCYHVVIINQHTHVIIIHVQSHHPQHMCDCSSHAMVAAAP